MSLQVSAQTLPFFSWTLFMRSISSDVLHVELRPFNPCYSKEITVNFVGNTSDYCTLPSYNSIALVDSYQNCYQLVVLTLNFCSLFTCQYNLQLLSLKLMLFSSKSPSSQACSESSSYPPLWVWFPSILTVYRFI